MFDGRNAFEMSEKDVLDALGTDPRAGLSASRAAALRHEFGPNALAQRKGKGSLVRFLLQFHAPLVYILIAAGVVTAWLGETIDASVIFGVVLVNAVVGFLQEAKALTAIDALSRGLSRTATVIREGRRQDLFAEELVPGDIVRLQSGDKVPADLRLIDIRDLQVDESALTGESVPVEKHLGTLLSDTGLADRRNMAYASSLVTYGTATGVVTAIGDQSEVGRISEMIASAEEVETPLTRRIARFSNVLLVVILVLSGLTFGIGVIRDAPWLETLLAAVALAVGAIPEGLPAAVTVMLAIGVSRMARRRAIIRKLPAVETLGSTTVICTDKTGTLTHNQMTVREILVRGRAYRVTGEGYGPEGEIVPVDDGHGGGDDASLGELGEILICGALCNDAVLRQTDEGWRTEGDPTEGALLTSAMKGGVDPEALRAKMPREDAIPFESEHRYMATSHRTGDAETSGVVYIKGSVEQVLKRCDHAVTPDGETAAVDTAALQAQADALARKGLRVLAFARKAAPEEAFQNLTREAVDSGCRLLGFQAMIDPPRTEAKQAVEICRRAGISVKMITGDHAVTAEAIAAEVGILDRGARHGHPVVTGRELETMDDDALSAAAAASSVFARVTPESKLRLVRALQNAGHVVAMTGDGVNDAPALRTADIGVAMGRKGTEVARDAAAMVLTDDNFATIAAAVREGRGVFDNLVKFVAWTLPTNIGEGLVLLAAVVLGTELPIRPVQALWINMTTVVTLGTMLAFEPADPDIMTRPPRDPGGALLPRGLSIQIALVSLLICVGAFVMFQWETSLGAALASAQTATTGFIVSADILYLLSCRSFQQSLLTRSPFSNPWIWLGIAVMGLLQAAFTYLPVMNRFFHAEPLSAEAWGRIGMVCLVFIVMVEVVKRRVGSRD